ncbi:MULTISPECIES: S4 domain-containing protein YaaA [Lactobacillaceae]|uniref:S4 domain-containing protein YaaA n=1 Tax=Lactobacillaceae TaxID=33958 RepID=UPI000C1B75A4|nr:MULTISPECIES: S4 domain-containing protein YaaA [Lactobacillaceae]
MSEKITIETEFITLGQAIKEAGIVGTGGQAKMYLKDNMVQVNGEDENRRGRKLYSGDVLVIENTTFEIA